MAKTVGCEGLRSLHRPETLARHRLLYAAVRADALQRVADREAGHDAVPALRERREHPLDHLVGHQRARRVAEEDDERVARHLGEPRPHRVAPRLAARHARVHLAAAFLLGDEDRRLLPARRRDEDHPVYPRTGLEPAQRLGQERLRSPPLRPPWPGPPPPLPPAP